MAVELLDKNWRAELRHGRPFFAGAGSHGNSELLRRVWKRVHDEFLQQFIAKHPGKRTFAWWCFDHEQERPIINAEQFPEFDRSQHELHSFLHTSLFAVIDGRLTPLQEPKRDYLERLGLLTDVECSTLGEVDLSYTEK